MRRQSAVPRSALARVLFLVTGVALTACTPKERPPAQLPGALTKPIDQYTGDELYDLVKRLKWGGGADRERKCKGDSACDGSQPSKRTMVRVDAVDGQDSLSALNLPANGVIGVRALNKGEQVEERYGFKPDKKLEYYLIVLPGSAKSGTWQLEELDTTPGARRHTKVGGGTFTPCNHPFQPGRVNRANFYTCADSHMSDSVQKSGLLMFDPKTDPLWMDCAQGCCMAEG
ncbi:MAG: hypothetical protein JWL95_570 [Gemmatimonadetes bacterium]|nr:hypothetical protein [Gemmatimonadota bacterium]